MTLKSATALGVRKARQGAPREERVRPAKRWEASLRLALEMIGAWLELQDGHHARWHDAVAKARDLGFDRDP